MIWFKRMKVNIKEAIGWTDYYIWCWSKDKDNSKMYLRFTWRTWKYFLFGK